MTNLTKTAPRSVAGWLAMLREVNTLSAWKEQDMKIQLREVTTFFNDIMEANAAEGLTVPSFVDVHKCHISLVALLPYVDDSQKVEDDMAFAHARETVSNILYALQAEWRAWGI